MWAVHRSRANRSTENQRASSKNSLRLTADQFNAVRQRVASNTDLQVVVLLPETLLDLQKYLDCKPVRLHICRVAILSTTKQGFIPLD